MWKLEVECALNLNFNDIDCYIHGWQIEPTKIRRDLLLIRYIWSIYLGSKKDIIIVEKLHVKCNSIGQKFLNSLYWFVLSQIQRYIWPGFFPLMCYMRYLVFRWLIKNKNPQQPNVSHAFNFKVTFTCSHGTRTVTFELILYYLLKMSNKKSI